MLRLAWPQADPPDGLSWSGGIYTDPAYNYLAARYAADPPGEPTVTLTVRWIYPLLTGLVRALGNVGGVTHGTTTGLAVALGVVTLLVLVGLVRRTAGPRAAWIALALGAVFHWLILFSRVLMAEHVMVLLVTLAAGAALGRTPWHQAAAGALAALATLFGKYHGLGPSIGILAFVAARRANRRSVLAFVGAAGVVATVWLFTIFLPHRAEILAWVGSYTSAGQQEPPILTGAKAGLVEVFRTFRNAYVVHRAPVIALLGGTFIVWTLGRGETRRNRLADGSALFAFWFAGAFLLHAVLAYSPPRYFIAVVYPLLGAAACQAAEMMRVPHLPSIRRADTWLPLAILCVFTGAGAVRTAELATAFVRDSLLLDRKIRGEPIPAFLDWTTHVSTTEQNVIWGLVVGGALLGGVAWWLRGKADRPFTAAPRLAVAALSVAFLVNLGQWGWWATHRSERLATIRRSLAAIVGPGGIVLGSYAPALTEGSDLRAVWYPLAPGEGGGGLLAARGVTHVILAEPSPTTPADLDADFPGLSERLRTVHTWRVNLSSVRGLHLYRVDGALPGRHPRYEPTELELACEAANADDLAACLVHVERHREAGGVETPELLFYESVSRFGFGQRQRAAELLARAAAMDPGAPDVLRSLGLAARMRGDDALAQEAWKRSLRLDSGDGDLLMQYRALLAGATGRVATPTSDPDRRERLREHLRRELGERYDEPLPQVAEPGQRRGAELWSLLCAGCHAEDGRGRRTLSQLLPVPPGDLTDPERAVFYSERARLRIVTDGIDGTSMFGWGEVLGESDLRAVVAHLQSLAK